MNKLAFIVVLAIYGLLGFRGVAQAQEKPALWDPKTFSIGAGVGYEAEIGENEAATGSPTLVAYLARPLTDFAFQCRGSWSITEGDVRVSPAIHYRFPVLGEQFAGALNYDFYAVNNVPYPANEWSVGVVWSRQLGRNLVVGASASYGLDTHDFRPTAELRIPLKTARN